MLVLVHHILDILAGKGGGSPVCLVNIVGFVYLADRDGVCPMCLADTVSFVS